MPNRAITHERSPLTGLPARPDARNRISVVVPTFNREHWIVKALQSLQRQDTGDEFDFEVIVVDNDSKDNTQQRVQELIPISPVPLHYFCQTEPGDAPTRNCGLQQARGNWLEFFDDDQIAEPNWLLELYRAANRLDAQIVGGAVHLHLPEERLAELGVLCRRALRELRLYDADHPYIGNQLPGTGNALVARTVFNEVGMFDASMRGGGSDSDFFMRARRVGHGMWYTPSAIIRHRIPEQRMTPEYFRWNALAGGAGHAAHFDFKKHGKLGLLVLCFLRTCHALLCTAPRIGWAWIRGNKPNYWVARRCGGAPKDIYAVRYECYSPSSAGNRHSSTGSSFEMDAWWAKLKRHE